MQNDHWPFPVTRPYLCHAKWPLAISRDTSLPVSRKMTTGLFPWHIPHLCHTKWPLAFSRDTSLVCVMQNDHWPFPVTPPSPVSCKMTTGHFPWHLPHLCHAKWPLAISRDTSLTCHAKWPLAISCGTSLPAYAWAFPSIQVLNMRWKGWRNPYQYIFCSL